MSTLHAGANETVTVKYYVEYPSEDKYPCGVSQEPIPNPVHVVILADSAAFEVIRNAVDQYGSSYNFTATYYQNTGYVIDAINNMCPILSLVNHPVCAFGTSSFSIQLGQRYHHMRVSQNTPLTVMDLV